SKGGVTGYKITYSLNKKFKTKKSVKVKKTTDVVKKLRYGRTYNVKVRAFKKVNGQKIYGKYSAVKRVRVREDLRKGYVRTVTENCHKNYSRNGMPGDRRHPVSALFMPV